MTEYAPGTVLEDEDEDRWIVLPEGWASPFEDESSACSLAFVEDSYGPLKVVEEPKKSLWDEDPFKGTFRPAEGYTTKDSGERQIYESGMQRDTDDHKPMFDLLYADGVPFDEQMLTRWAHLMRRGAQKYGKRNWLKGNGPEELERAIASALRHLFQWAMGETDEDHAAAVMANIMFAEYFRYRIRSCGGE